MTVLRFPCSALLVSICIVIVSLLACESAAEVADRPQLTPEPTYTSVPVFPTSTPYPTATPEPTYTPVPALPTSTPYPTATPEPTYTPVPALPTSTPYPTATPSPTATSTPTPIQALPRQVGQEYITTDGLEITLHSVELSKAGNVTVITVRSTVKNTTPDLRGGAYWRLHYQDGGRDTQGTISYPNLIPEQQAHINARFYVQPPDVPMTLALLRWPDRTGAMDADGALIWEVK